MDGKITALLIWLGVALALSATLSGQTRAERIDRATSYHASGNDFYNNDQLDSAIHYYRLAVAEREVLFAEAPTLALGKSHFNLGAALKYLARYKEALPELERALDIYLMLDLGPAQVHRIPKTCLELAYAHAGLSDYERAKTYLRTAAAQTVTATDSTMHSLSDLYPSVLSEWSGILMTQDSLDVAIEMAEQSLAAYEALDAPVDYYEYEASLPHFNLANALNKAGRLQEAEREYLRVIPIFGDYGDADNLTMATNSLISQLIEAKRFTEAKRWQKRVLPLAEGNADPRIRAQFHDHRGALLLAEGEAQLAVRAFQRAQTELLPAFQPAALADAPSAAQYETADKLADLLLYTKDQARALGALVESGAMAPAPYAKFFRAGDSLITEIHQRQGNTVSKRFWRQEAHGFYEQAIAACAAADDQKSAWRYFERSKAILLYEAVAKVDALGLLPDSLRAEYERLQAVATGQQTTPAALNKANQARKNLSTLQASLSANYPRFARLTSARAPITREELAKKVTGLPNDSQALLSYFFGKERVYCLYADREVESVHDLGNSDSLRQAVSELMAYFSSPSAITNDPQGYAHTAHQAWLRFVAPLPLRPRQNLLVLPDGPLAFVPFAALLTEIPKTDRFKNFPFLVLERQVTYGHSASILSYDGQPTSRTVPIAAFAPFSDGTSPQPYPKLAFAQDELQEITDSYTTDLRRDSTATLAAFRRLGSSKGILHLSTHAIASTETEAASVAFYDQSLTLQELYRTEIDADLVVLSACQTNVGKSLAGEGVMSLGRAFRQAGAGSVIASLWNVNTRSGGRILTDFYAQLNEGLTKGAALNAAQQNYLRNPEIRDTDKSPYYWASLTYYGRETVLSPQLKRAYLPWLLTFSAILLITLLILPRLRNKV